MTAKEWNTQWHRLDHFHVSGDRDRHELEIEWFAQLKHWHMDAVEFGVTQLIGSAKDNFLPGLGLLKDYIQSRIGRYDRTHGKCATCHGSTWIDVGPYKVGEIVYSSAVIRCPDCGVPAPQVEAHTRRQPLSDLGAHEYQAGRYGRDQMPDGLKGKPWEPGAKDAHKTAMREAFDKLRIKLFGKDKDAA